MRGESVSQQFGGIGQFVFGNGVVDLCFKGAAFKQLNRLTFHLSLYHQI